MDGRGANLNRKSEAPAVPGQVPLNRWNAVIRGGKPQRRVSITKTDFDSGDSPREDGPLRYAIRSKDRQQWFDEPASGFLPCSHPQEERSAITNPTLFGRCDACHSAYSR